MDPGFRRGDGRAIGAGHAADPPLFTEGAVDGGDGRWRRAQQEGRPPLPDRERTPELARQSRA